MLFYKVLNKISLIIFLFLFVNVYGQKINTNKVCKSLNVANFSIKGIDFIVYNKGNKPKPILLFIRGNGAIPLIIDNTLAGAFPFKVDSLSKDFSYVVVSKPGLPLCVDSIHHKYINIKKGKVVYIDNNDIKPLDYVKNNNKDSLTSRINKVIDFLAAQSWVDKKQIFVVGHSAGAYVAAELAKINSKVSKVVCMSTNPYGRFQQKIRNIRYKESYEIITSQTANNLIDSVYAEYLILYKNRHNNKKMYDSDTYLSWGSFTFPNLKTILLSINKPILYVYGTGDIDKLDADYLQLDFINNEKQNLDIKRYTGLNHNFMNNNYDKNGKVTGRNFYWNKVIKELVSWLKKN